MFLMELILYVASLLMLLNLVKSSVSYGVNSLCGKLVNVVKPG